MKDISSKISLNSINWASQIILWITVSFDLIWNIINPFKPEFTIVTFTHYKPRIAVAILDLGPIMDEGDVKWATNEKKMIFNIDRLKKNLKPPFF